MVSPGKLIVKMKDFIFKTQYSLFQRLYSSKPVTLETIEMGLRIYQPSRVKGYSTQSSNNKVLVFLPSLIKTNEWLKTLAKALEEDTKVNALFYECKAETMYIYDWANTIPGYTKENNYNLLVELKTHLQRVVVYLKDDPRTSISSQINRRVIQSQLVNIAVLIDSLNQCSL